MVTIFHSDGFRARSHCRNYVAAHIVEPLITRNREKFARINVDFRIIDTRRELGDFSCLAGLTLGYAAGHALDSTTTAIERLGKQPEAALPLPQKA